MSPQVTPSLTWPVPTCSELDWPDPELPAWPWPEGPCWECPLPGGGGRGRPSSHPPRRAPRRPLTSPPGLPRPGPQQPRLRSLCCGDPGSLTSQEDGPWGKGPASTLLILPLGHPHTCSGLSKYAESQARPLGGNQHPTTPTLQILVLRKQAWGPHGRSLCPGHRPGGSDTCGHPQGCDQVWG